jgi:hypothetical protein
LLVILCPSGDFTDHCSLPSESNSTIESPIRANRLPRGVPR